MQTFLDSIKLAKEKNLNALNVEQAENHFWSPKPSQAAGALAEKKIR